MDWYKHSQYIPDEIKTLDQAEAAYALREAWYRIYGAYPSDRSLAVLWAKSCLETGRWKYIHCYNFGNIKKKMNPDDGHYFTMFRCGEVINGKHQMFDPPHYQTHFRAYKTVADGAEDYLRFVSQKTRYQKAWQEVIRGNPSGYSHELKIAGYYTADEARYTAGVVRLFDEFMRRKEELMSWIPKEEHDTDPSPPASLEHDTDMDLHPPVHVEEHDTEVNNEIPVPEVPKVQEPEIVSKVPEPEISIIKPVKPVRGNEFVTLVAVIITGLSALFALLFGGF
jgi:hypothetical protein